MGKRGVSKPVTQCSCSRRAKTIALAAYGMRPSLVARRVGICRATVYNTLKRAQGSWNLHDKTRTGRPKRANPAIVARIKRMRLRKSAPSVRGIQTELARKNIHLGRGTVHRALHDGGLRSVRLPKKPKLTANQKTARVEWLQAQLDSKEQEWFRTVYTDEKIFRLGETHRTRWIRLEDPIPYRPTGKRKRKPK
jgi:transposase